MHTLSSQENLMSDEGEVMNESRLRKYKVKIE